MGKTTAKEVIASVLSRRFNTLKTEANLNTEIGVPLSLLKLTQEHDRAVLELGMYLPGDIALLARIAQPEVGVVTNVGPVHLERVEDRVDHLWWRELVGRHHYLSYRVPFGAQLRYLAFVSRPERAVVAAVQVSSAAWRLALTAVIEETGGAKSYWALKHAPGKPDFHHADGFVLELP